MRNLSVIKRLMALLGVASAALAIVVVAMFVVTGNLKSGLGGLVQRMGKDQLTTVGIINTLSDAQALLYRIAREHDPDSLEVFLKRQDSLTATAKHAADLFHDASVSAGLDSLGMSAKQVIDLVLVGNYGVAQQLVVEKYNPTYSSLMDKIGGISELRTEENRATNEKESVRANTMTRISAVVSLAAFAFLLLLAIPIIQGIRKSLRAMNDTLGDLVQGEGDLSQRLHVGSEDEFGTMAGLFNRFLDQQSAIIGAVVKTTSHVSDVSGGLGKNADDIAQTARTVSDTAQNVASAVEQSSASLKGISQNASDMSVMVSTVASAMEELAASLRLTEERCKEEVLATDKGKKTAEQTKATIAKLDASAQEISNVVDTIRDIAEQTNLLALNATIEAATAGEAGKGFAVVASEVKELARQTAQATETIANQAEAMRDATTDTIKALELIGNIIEKIAQSSQQIQKSVAEQTITVHEVTDSGARASSSAQGIVHNVKESAAGLHEISQNAGNLDRAAAKTLKGIEEVHASVGTLTRNAAELSQIVERFKV